MNEDISKGVSAFRCTFSPEKFLNLLNPLSILQYKLLFLLCLLNSLAIRYLLYTNLDIIIVVMMMFVFESFLQYQWLHEEHDRHTQEEDQ